MCYTKSVYYLETNQKCPDYQGVDQFGTSTECVGIIQYSFSTFTDCNYNVFTMILNYQIFTPNT